MASAEEKRRCRTVPDRFPSANNQHMVLGRKGMTTPVCIQQSIRQLETKGLAHTQIARELGVSRTTVVKYATRDYSPVPPTGRTASRSLVAGEYARKADEWLEADRRMPRKQRHTARRVHERLVEECGFEGSYSSVQRWAKRRRQLHRGEAEGFSEMEWMPGSAQVDFGQALAVVAGVERTVHFLVVSFPVLEHEIRGRAARRDRGMRVPWPEQGVLPCRHGPPRAGVRQRHRGRPPQGRRDRHPDEAVLAVLRALRLRDEVLQPVFRAREGQYRERGRFPAPQPDGADAVRGGMAHGRVAGTLRRDRARHPLPRGRADPGLVRDEPRPHAPAAAVHVRRVRLARGEGRQDRNGHDRLEPLPRGPEMAFHASHGRCAGPAGRAAFHGRRADRHAGAQVGPQPRHRDGPAVAARHHRAQAAFVGRESHTLRLPG